MRALLSQHRLLVGEVLLRALRLVAQLVDEVAAVVADGVLVVVATVLEVADAFNGDERARRRFANQPILARQPGRNRQRRDALAAIEHFHPLRLLVHHQPEIAVRRDGFEPLHRHPALDIPAGFMLPRADVRPAALNLHDLDALALPVERPQCLAIRRRLVIHLLMADRRNVHHDARLHHHVPHCRVVHVPRRHDAARFRHRNDGALAFLHRHTHIAHIRRVALRVEAQQVVPFRHLFALHAPVPADFRRAAERLF